MTARRVVRNYTYVVLGLGIDVLLLAVGLPLILGHGMAALVVLALLLVPGARLAMVRVVTDANGVRVVNFWRTHRLAWREVDGFVVNQRNVERRRRLGRRRGFVGLACVRTTGGRELTLGALSASSSLTPSTQMESRRLPEMVERLNAARPD